MNLRRCPVSIPALAAALLCLAAATPETRGDILFYRIPGTNLEVVLHGRTSTAPGGAVFYHHPKFGRVIFSLTQDGIRFEETDPLTTLFRKELQPAKSRRDADLALQAAQWALRHGLIDEVWEAAQLAWECNPQHPEVKRLLELKKKMDQPIPESKRLEGELKALVRKPDMKIARSEHFILLHDTPDKPGEKRKLPRAQERLELLERVYQGFLLKFSSAGVQLTVPKERMKVVLFREYQDFVRFSQRLDPELKKAAGFWDSQKNVSVFFDQGTLEEFKAIRKLADEFQELKREAVRKKSRDAAEIVRLADVLSLLVEISQEDSDIETVSHEAAHQMAGNTDLLPRAVQIPSWVHEGLATYFESPSDASWSGIGAVNSQRLRWYRGLADDREHSNIRFIIADQIFDYAGSHGSTLHGYGQAWALTHFLMERHFEEFMAYYRRLGEMPPDVVLSQQVLTRLFDESFATDYEGLDIEWRSYMDSLRTDMEVLLGE